MIPKGLFSQIAMIVVSVGVLYTYVYPVFKEVEQTQSQISVYKKEREKVNQVNAKLNSLLAKSNEISATDQIYLATYLPNSVDAVAVQRDILFIAEEAGINLTGISGGARGGGESRGASDGRSKLVPYVFSTSFTAPYGKIKSFLSLVGRNNYPLEVTKLTIGGASADGEEATEGTLNVSLELTTYSLELASNSY